MQFIDLKTQYQDLKQDIDARIHAVLDHGQYIMGPEVIELEEKLAAFTGAKHCVGVASGTDALLIAMMALGVKAGDEVITTPFTFIATGEMIALLGATPVFVDIDPRTYNLDPKLIGQAITPKTKAIMPVSLYGQCADLDAINQVAAKHRIPVIEDAAQSFGATYKQRTSCSLSTIGCTSFFPSKPLGCYGDAGACFTDDDDLAQAMREIRVHGQERRYYHPVIGLNGRLDTLQAAVLLAKIDKFTGEEIDARARIGDNYGHLLEKSGVGLTAPFVEDFNTSVYAQYTIEVDDRDSLQAGLKQLGIPTAVHYPVPLNLQPAFSKLNKPRGSFPVAEKSASRVMSLPMHPYLKDETQEKIVQSLTELIAQR